VMEELSYVLLIDSHAMDVFVVQTLIPFRQGKINCLLCKNWLQVVCIITHFSLHKIVLLYNLHGFRVV
jgi:hypothetical protein